MHLAFQNLLALQNQINQNHGGNLAPVPGKIYAQTSLDKACAELVEGRCRTMACCSTPFE
jgi:hypothetical protein